MGRISKERRQSILIRLGPPFNEPVKEVAASEGISKSLVYRWLAVEREEEARLLMPEEQLPVEEGEALVPEEACASWSARDKFAAVIETAAMNESELSAYCRSRGLYPERLALWREACERATDWAEQRGQKQSEMDKESARRIRNLERELARKEKALAEAAALLMLRKKATVIWGDEDA